MKKAVSRYLDRHAEPEIALAERIAGPFAAAVVMPACGESAECLAGLAPAIEAGALAIVVINATSDAGLATRAANSELLLAATADAEPVGSGAWLDRRRGLLAIDRASPGRTLPPRQGVGLARKIGCDVALALWARGQLGSRFIHWADADAQEPADLISSAAAVPDEAVALVYRFEHVACGDAAVDAAHARYESYLRYHRLGLQHARSPYAHHSVGSALAFDARAYAAVRGVPKLLAAEDFYCLDKVAKIGAVCTPASAPVRIGARRSARVPFGTGRATAEIAARQASGRSYPVGHPHGYALLGAWLAAVEAGIARRDLGAALAELSALDCCRWAETAFEPADRRLLMLALDATRSIAALKAALGDRSAKDLARRVHDALDGKRTVKLLHALRDGCPGAPGLGELPLEEALRAAPFVGDLSASAEPEEVRAALARVDEAKFACLADSHRRGRGN